MTTTPLVRRLGALCALALLGACGLPEPSAAPRSARYRADVPLVARIQTTSLGRSDGMRFYLNRPAHVALFEVIPGRGVGLLYPTGSFSNPMFSSGLHQARSYNTFFRASYLPETAALGAQPRYILLVASERPLRLEEIQRSPYGLRSVVGLQHFASFNPYNTMEALTESVLPAMVADADWATDVYVEWPDARVSRPMMQLVRVQCPNGRTLTVPFDVMMQSVAICGTGTQPKYLPPPLDPSDANDVRPPRRTRPVAEGSAGSPARGEGSQNTRGSEAPREPRVARPRPESSEPRVRNSPPREAAAPRAEPRSEPRPAPRAEPRAEPRPSSAPSSAPRAEPSQPRVERPTPREQR